MLYAQTGAGITASKLVGSYTAREALARLLENTSLEAKWLDDQLATFDKVYSGKRPRYLDGYNKLKAAIKPWGTK